MIKTLETEIGGERYQVSVTENGPYVFCVHRTNTGWAYLPGRCRPMKSRIASRLRKEIQQAMNEIKMEMHK